MKCIVMLGGMISLTCMACSAAESWSTERMERFLCGSCRFVESDFVDENAVDVSNRNRDALPLFEEVIRENHWTTNELVQALINVASNGLATSSWEFTESRAD